MRKFFLAITGMGNVGRRLLELIDRKRELAASRFDIELIISGICDSSGAVLNLNGIDIAEALATKEKKKGICTLQSGVTGMKSAEFMQSVKADLLVELTPTNLKDGEPGLGAIRTALTKGMHVVSANKGPLVLAYSELAELAKSKNVRLLYSATVTGGLPTLNVGMRDLCATTINKIEGVLNGTTNYILTKMAEGQSYSDALKRAQEIGMAETDPSLDVDGWDAACKLVIIANAVLRRPTTLGDVKVQGISGVTIEQLQKAEAENQAIKLIALAERKNDDYEFSVKPTSLPRSHRLATINGGMMGVIYNTDINGEMFLCIDESDPYPTAAAVLRDIVHIAAKI
ncbi:homoserine dehydrogenase [bacterium]|nr:homoserine dehydrogenase [bacterium]